MGKLENSAAPGATPASVAAAQAAAIAAGLGANQTWQNMSASRLFATVYTNTTGKPIAISVSIGVAAGASSIATTNGAGLTLAYNFNNSVSATRVSTEAIIPAGDTYRVDKLGTLSFLEWNELR